MLTDEQIKLKYGKPGDVANLTIIKLPYPMRIAWDPKSSVKAIQCHNLIAENLLGVFNDLLSHYGTQQLTELEIDVFGGCYNFRAMRGTEHNAIPKWSRHSWGIAIDLNPTKNQLRVPWKESQFSKPEYQMMIEIFYNHGFFSLGKEKNYDAMHFEINS